MELSRKGLILNAENTEGGRIQLKKRKKGVISHLAEKKSGFLSEKEVFS